MEYEKPYQYGKPVLISHWSDREESYPLDNPNPNHPIASHYRTFGITDDIYVPKTSTQELLETGMQQKTKHPPIVKHELNFITYPYPIPGKRLKLFGNLAPHEEKAPLVTTYNAGFKPPKPLIVKPNCCEKPPDPLLNRIPKCDFEMLPSSPNMFMDDHLTMISEGRKKINFLRQMRNSTYLFEQ